MTINNFLHEIKQIIMIIQVRCIILSFAITRSSITLMLT